MTPIKTDALLALSQLELINISLNHCDPNAYESEMGFPSNKPPRILIVSTNVFPLREVRATIRQVGDAPEEDAAFIRYCNGRWPNFIARTTTCKDFVGQVTNPVRTYHNRLGNMDKTTIFPGCRQWFQMTVAASGETALCCFDGNLQWKMGNIRNNSLLELYNAARKQRLKHCATRIEAPAPCRECDIIFA